MEFSGCYGSNSLLHTTGALIIALNIWTSLYDWGIKFSSAAPIIQFYRSIWGLFLLTCITVIYVLLLDRPSAD